MQQGGKGRKIACQPVALSHLRHETNNAPYSAEAVSPSAAEGNPDSPHSPAAPWTMPAKFLPLPKGFSCPGGSTKIDLRNKAHSQLMALAARHNSRQGITRDPFQAALTGIPERAQMCPGSRVAQTHTMGSVPADSPYAKAWRSIKRKHVRGATGKAKGADDAAAKVSRRV